MKKITVNRAKITEKSEQPSNIDSCIGLKPRKAQLHVNVPYDLYNLFMNKTRENEENASEATIRFIENYCNK